MSIKQETAICNHSNEGRNGHVQQQFAKTVTIRRSNSLSSQVWLFVAIYHHPLE